MITLITGGHRAGKTTMALRIASQHVNKSYIATAEAIDDEMSEKIKNHQKERDNSYKTIEEPLELDTAIKTANGDILIVDCLTMWINNLLYYKQDCSERIDILCEMLKNINKEIIFITNESSLCLIPGDKESRRYLNLLAEVNRRVAERADNVCLMVSGIALWVKGEKPC